MADNKINVGGRLHSIATGNILAGADEILDDNIGKKQSEVNIDVDNALADRYTKGETYNKNQLNNLITTPNQEYVTVEDYASLPESGEANTIYRVSNWDGSLAIPATDITKYSEYAWNGSQYIFLCVKSQIGEVFDISAANSGTTYADLTEALGTNGTNVPVSVRKGGMSIKFIQTSDNKYVQYRLISNQFSTTVSDWQGVDDEPTAGSDNLAKSSGIYVSNFYNSGFSYGNLIDYNNKGILLDKGIETHGDIVDHTDCAVSHPIRVIPGKIYRYRTPAAFPVAIQYQDFEGNKIGYDLFNGQQMQNRYRDITIPHNAYYCVVTIKLPEHPSGFYFGLLYSEKQQTYLSPDGLNPYEISNAIENAVGKNNLYVKDSPRNLIDYGLTQTGEVSYYEGLVTSYPIQVKCHNMVNFTNIQYNKGIDTKGNILDYDDGAISGPIYGIEGGKQYTFFGDKMRGLNICIRFEDSSENKVGYELIQNFRGIHKFTAPENAERCIVPIKTSGIATGAVGLSLSENEGWTSIFGLYVFDEKDAVNRGIRLERKDGSKVAGMQTGVRNRTLINIPWGVEYVRLGNLSEDARFYEAYQYQNYPYKGKKIALYGDSITVDYYSEVYAAMMKTLLQADEVLRFGKSGGNFAHDLQASQYLTPLLNSNPDVVIIHSVNSHRANVPLGNMGSTEGEASDIGGLKHIVNSLISNNKNIEIYFCTPLCYGDVKELGYENSFGSTSPNTLGKYLSDYVRNYEDFCRNYGLNLVNLTEKCGFKDSVESFASTRYYTLDGVHPNYHGYKRMTGIIADYINNKPYNI